MGMGKPSSWEDRIAIAVGFGEFISWREISAYTEGLSNVQTELDEYSKHKPSDALPIFEIFIAACLVKAGEVDGSRDNLSIIVDDLFLGWARAAGASGMSGEEFVRKINHWMNVDDFGYCYDLESKVIPALNQNFILALQKSLEDRKVNGDQKSDEIIRKLFALTKNKTSLIAHCEKYGVTDADCLALSQMLYDDKEYHTALEWADKGLNFKSTVKSYELKKIKRSILKASGRELDAVADAWLDFENSPSIYTFETVVESSSLDGHAKLKAKAIPIFAKANFEDAAVAFHRLEEYELLVSRIKNADYENLQKISYSDAIPMAKTLSDKFPKEAAQIYVAHALLILDEKRPKAYHHAHDYLDAAKILMERSGDSSKWEQLVIDIRKEHCLKSSFMPGFNQIIEGKGAPREPTFMERIQSKLDRG